MTSSQASPRATSNGTVPLPTDPAALEAEIELRRRRLAETVDELTTRVHPKEIARRSKASAQQRFITATRAEDGSLRVERLAAVGAAVAAVIALLVWRRRH